MMAAAQLGMPIDVAFNFGAWEVNGPLAHGLKIAATIAVLALLIGTSLRLVSGSFRGSRLKTYTVVCLIIPAAAILSPVLSPQYFIWMIPLLLLLGLEVLPKVAWSYWLLSGLLVTIAALTTWIFPYHFFFNSEHPIGFIPWPYDVSASYSPIAASVLVRRNLLCLGVVAWLGVMGAKSMDRAQPIPLAGGP